MSTRQRRHSIRPRRMQAHPTETPLPFPTEQHACARIESLVQTQAHRMASVLRFSDQVA